jgi:hypothetical protein
LVKVVSSFLASRVSNSVPSREVLLAKLRDFGPIESLVAGDISSLFSSIPLPSLRSLLGIHLPSALPLFDSVASGWCVHFFGTFASLQGLPMGSHSSPVLANFFLWCLETSSSDQVATFRYVDDLVRLSAEGSGISASALRSSYELSVAPLQVVWKDKPDCLDLWLSQDPFTGGVAAGFKGKDISSPLALRGLPRDLSRSVAVAEFLRRTSASLGAADVSDMLEMFEIEPGEPLPDDLFDEVFRPMFEHVVAEFSAWASPLPRSGVDILRRAFFPPPARPSLSQFRLVLPWNVWWDLRPGRALLKFLRARLLSRGFALSVRWRFSSRKLGTVLCWKCPWVYVRRSL